MANPYRTVVDSNDISEINALICKIEEKLKGLKIIWKYKEREILLGKFINGKFYEKEWHKFAEVRDMKIYLMGFLRGLDFSL